ncbi:MAG: hypothetical protein AAF234_05010 [Pseudomonadota bacterium]
MSSVGARGLDCMHGYDTRKDFFFFVASANGIAKREADLRGADA